MRAFGEELGDDEPCFDGFSETHLVGQNASAFPDAPKSKNHGFDLVWVCVDLCCSLGCGISALLVRPSKADEILGKVPTLNRVQLAREGS